MYVTNKAKNTCNLVLIKFGFFYMQENPLKRIKKSVFGLKFHWMVGVL